MAWSCHAPPDSPCGAGEMVRSVRYFLDAGGRMDPAAIHRERERGAFRTASSTNFAYSTAAIWLDIPVPAIRPNQVCLLVLGNPIIDDVQVTLSDRGRMQTLQRTGDHIPFSKREILDRNLVVRLPPGFRGTILMRVVTTSAVVLPLRFWAEKAYREMALKEQFWLGAYFGSLLVILAFAVILLILLRDFLFLIYALYILTLALGQAAVTGVAYGILWGETIWWNDHALPLFVGLSLVFGSAFAYMFLRLSAARIWMRLYMGAAFFAACLLCAVALVPNPTYGYRMQQGVGLFVVLAAVVVALSRWREGYGPARFFLIGWSGLIVGVTVFILRNFGLVPDLLVTQYAIQIGSAMEVALLALALGDRIQTEARERAQLQKKLMETEALLGRLTEPPAADGIWLTVGRDSVFVEYGEILYVSSIRNVSVIHGAGQDFRVPSPLKALEERLLPGRFLRVHKQFLLNVPKVQEIRKRGERAFVAILRDSDETEVPIGGNYLARLRARLGLAGQTGSGTTKTERAR